MNEALLIILILITGITFFNLVKKVGISAPVTVAALHPNAAVNYPENFANIMYSGDNNNTNKVYNNLWSVTATTDINNNPALNKITVVYHQHKKVKNIFDYAGTDGYESRFTSDGAFIHPDVCVSSNISDMQYRHVLHEGK